MCQMDECFLLTESQVTQPPHLLLEVNKSAAHQHSVRHTSHDRQPGQIHDHTDGNAHTHTNKHTQTNTHTNTGMLPNTFVRLIICLISQYWLLSTETQASDIMCVCVNVCVCTCWVFQGRVFVEEVLVIRGRARGSRLSRGVLERRGSTWSSQTVTFTEPCIHTTSQYSDTHTHKWMCLCVCMFLRRRVRVRVVPRFCWPQRSTVKG